MNTTSRSLLAKLTLVGAVLAAAGATAVAPMFGPTVAGAQATPTISVSPNVVPVSQATTVTVSGAGYLVPGHTPDKNVFGGVYVLFGWVAPGATWGPSNRNGTTPDGQYGITYTYNGERSAETRDDGSGTNRFVSFTAGGISGESTSFHMQMENAEGTRGKWTTTLTIYGSTFAWVNPATGASETVNCLQVQCGVYTIGAHGVTSRTNELFTPILFSNGGTPTVPAPSPSLPSGGGGGGGVTPTTARNNQPAVTQPGSTNRTPTTVRNNTPQATTTVPSVVAGETTVVGDTTTTSTVAPTDSTTAPSTTDSSGPTTPRRDRDASANGDAIESAGTVRVISGSDGGVSPWIWGTAVGAPTVAAGGVLLRRRRLADH